LFDEGRSILGQRIRTENGLTLGMCGDVQFDTQTFTIEWLFPRRWWRWGRPLPASAIVEVRPDAVIVRDQLAKTEPITAKVLQTLDQLAEPVVPQTPST
jgi:hypothetical protein